MFGCGLYLDCLKHYVMKVRAFDMVIYVHLLPSFPVIDVHLFLVGDSWVNVFHDKWNIYRDYNFVLWWNFGW